MHLTLNLTLFSKDHINPYPAGTENDLHLPPEYRGAGPPCSLCSLTKFYTVMSDGLPVIILISLDSSKTGSWIILLTGSFKGIIC